MRTAVIRVNLDPAGEVAVEHLSRTVEVLRRRGIEVLAPDLSQMPPGAREVELIVQGDNPAELSSWAEATCTEALGAPGPRAGATTFLSRGTDDDALGVVHAFGITADLKRFEENGEEIAAFTISPADATHIAESRLRTALEAALNCEVRINVA